MTRPELDALIALHDRWSAYDLIVALFTLGAGTVLLTIGAVAVANGETSMGLVVGVVGAVVFLLALVKEPYQGR